MATQTVVQMIDDLDFSPGDDVSSIPFAVDGVQYSIDLNARHSDEFMRALSPYIAAARRVGGKVPPRPASSDAKKVREWARQNGIKVNARGRVPEPVVARFRDATSS